MSERWLVAMSGGVDSSVAAALMARAGHEVVGVTMDLGQGLGGQPLASGGKRCCGLPDAEDAREVAAALGIRHYTANYRDEFRAAVVEPFADAYTAGRTPIPCVACNRVLKFDLLLRRAEALGARGVATGHYARLAPPRTGAPASTARATAPRTRPTSCSTWRAPRSNGSRSRSASSRRPRCARWRASSAWSPPTSPRVWASASCPTATCAARSTACAPTRVRAAGPIATADGRVLGEHGGAAGFTPGQRHGLGLSGGPWYVAEVRTAENTLVVGRAARAREAERLDRERELARRRAARRRPCAPRSATATRRCRPECLPDARGGAELRFAEPVWAPAPGQAAVVYDAADERVLGGGWIAARA